MNAVIVIAAVVAALAAVANWWSRVADGPTADRVELVSKPLATIAIAIVGVTLGVMHDAPASALAAGIVGFVCCLAGDVALLPIIDRFVVGLASFLVGHVAFIVMFVLLGLDEVRLAVPALIAVAVLVATLGRRIVAGATAQDAALRVPVLAYLAVISTMAVVGWSTGIAAALIGSTLFVASDSILGWRQFVGGGRWLAPAVMITYHAALLGLALSLA